jgi:hypothetical protein
MGWISRTSFKAYCLDVGTVARVLKCVVACLFDTHADQASRDTADGPVASEAIEDDHGQVLGRRHTLGKLRQCVQIPMIIRRQDLPLGERIQIDQIADHPCRCIYGASDRHIHDVVVPMAVRVVALAEHASVLLVGHVAAVQAVRRAEAVAARKMRNRCG